MKIVCYPELAELLATRAHSGRSGHFVVCSNAASFPPTVPSDLFDTMRGVSSLGRAKSALCVFECRSGPEPATLRLTFSEGAPDLDSGMAVGFAVQDAARHLALLPRPVLVVISGIECLPLPAQCDLLGSIRGVRESSSSCFQVLIVGEWAPHQFFREWRTTMDHRSPPLDEGNVFRLGAYSINALQDLFRGQLQGSRMSVAASIQRLFEHTGGDYRFIQYVASQIADGDRWTPEQLETLVFGLATRADVEDSARNASSALPIAARVQIEAILRHQYLKTSRDDLNIEILWLRGLVRPAEFSSSGVSDVTWEISSPLLAEILRRCWRWPEGGTAPTIDAGGVLPLRHAVVNEAIPFIWEIESLLRNLVHIRLGAKARGSEPLSVASEVQVEKRNVYLAAHSLRDSDARDPDLRLVRTPLTSFLDVGQLSAILLDEHLYEEYFRSFFGKKEALETRLRQFNSIRKAVAHGKEISCVALDRLVELRTWFGACLAAAASRWLQEQEQLSALRFDALVTKVFAIPNLKARRMQLTIRHLGTTPFRDLKFEVRTRGGLELGKTAGIALQPSEARHFQIDVPDTVAFAANDLEVFLILPGSREKLAAVAVQ